MTPSSLGTHAHLPLRVPQPLPLLSYFLGFKRTFSSFIICVFYCISRSSSKWQTEKHFPCSNLGPSYPGPVQIEDRAAQGFPLPRNPLSQALQCSLPPLIHLLTCLFLLQVLLASIDPPLSSKTESPREVSTEKREGKVGRRGKKT